MIFHTKLGGIFTLSKGKEGSDPTVISEFNNLILDSGLKRFGTSDDYLNYIHLGSGNSAPIPSQVALQNKLYSGDTRSPTNTWSSGLNSNDLAKPFIWFKRTFRVPPQNKNQSYSELGIGWSNSELFSRTLIKDPTGRPTTITILGDEYLDVTYELRLYIPTNTSVHTVVPTGDDPIPRRVTSRASSASTNTSGIHGWSLVRSGDSPVGFFSGITSNSSYFYNGEIQDIFKIPLGNVVGGYFNYTISSRPSDTSAIIKIARGLPDNVGTLRSLVISSYVFSYQLQFDPPFVKTNEDKFEMEIQLSWGRYEDAT